MLADFDEDYRCWLDWTAGTWAGPLADECGGSSGGGGDNDCDGDVPEVAHYSELREWGARFPLGGVMPFVERTEAEAYCRDAPHRRTLVRTYWPPDCDGADDSPRDCLTA